MYREVRFCAFVLAIAASAMVGSQLQARHYNVPNAHYYLEHLVRHSDELLTEINLTRANQFLIAPQVVTVVQRGGGWAGGFYQHLLVDVQNPNRSPEYFVGKMVNHFRMQTILLYDYWWKSRATNPALVEQFRRTDYAYRNAISATYFFIESLRRTYIVNGAYRRPFSQEVLIRRLTKLERLAFEIRSVMKTIRYAALFNFPVPRYCPETTFSSYRINVSVNQPLPYIPFPYRYEDRFWTTNDVRPVESSQPNYNLDYWNNRWQQLDQGYINQPLPQQGPGNNGPGQYVPGDQDPGDNGPGYNPGQQGPGQYNPGQQGPGQYNPGQQGPGQYGPGQQGPGQYGPGQQGPSQQGPGQYPPQQGDDRTGGDYPPTRAPLRPSPVNQPNTPTGNVGDVAPTNDFDY